MRELLLTAAEIAELTQYGRPSRQLEELHRQGFFRARQGRSGAVILERAHYEAVCAGAATAPVRQPRLRTPDRKAA